MTVNREEHPAAVLLNDVVERVDLQRAMYVPAAPAVQIESEDLDTLQFATIETMQEVGVRVADWFRNELRESGMMHQIFPPTQVAGTVLLPDMPPMTEEEVLASIMPRRFPEIVPGLAERGENYMDNSQDGNSMPPILGFQKESLIDYPGHTASVIYFGGCNMRCPYCHNKDLVLMKGSKIADELISTYMDAQDVRYVVLTGGEVGLYLTRPVFMHWLHKLGRGGHTSIKLDTNGTTVLLPAPEISYTALDFKMPLRMYSQLDCMQTNNRIELLKTNLRIGLTWNMQALRSQKSSNFEIRTTVHKKLLSPDDLKEMEKNLKDDIRQEALVVADREVYEYALTGSWFLQQYRKCEGFDPELQDAETYSDEELTELAIDMGAIVRGVSDELTYKSIRSAVCRLQKYDVAKNMSDARVRLCKNL